MHFGILGTFEITKGTAVITPSAPKLRRVLALLTVLANSVVSTKLLIDELWEDQPPVSCATTLQTYIYQLRKLLDLGEPEADGDCDRTEPSVILQTRPGGYLLRLPENALDARRFERLAARGRAELASHQTAEAAETLREALALWRGPVLSDLEYGPVLHAEVIRLHELRNSVTELRVDADLNLGRHHQLVSELTAMTAKDPTHEGLHARLMLALYRAGRRSEALRVFQRIRATLAEELGLEPGPTLQLLHRGILSGDPELDLQPGRQCVNVTQPPVVPAQLPADVPLVGRTAQLKRVRDCLCADTPTSPTVVVVGLPGSGVSAFCLHVANSVREHFPDGQFWAELSTRDGERVDPVQILDRFLRAVGCPATSSCSDVAERAALFRSWCAGRRILVVLDNLIDSNDLEYLTPGSPGSATLVGSRRRVCGSRPALTVDLCPLSPSESMEFLRSAIGAERIEGDEAAVRQVIQFCGGLPAALRAVANEFILRPHWRVRDLLARMEDDQYQRRWLASTGIDVRRSVVSRYRMLAAPHRMILQDLAERGALEVTVASAAAMVGTAPQLTESALESCAELRLLDVECRSSAAPEGFRYRLHPFVRMVAVQA